MSYRTLSIGILAAACFAPSLFLALPASAADLDPGYADIPQQNVTFGSGWYIRGDIAATRLPAISVNPTTLPTRTNPTIPGAPTETLTNSSRLGYDGSIGAGYQFTNYIRADMTVDVHQPLATSSSAGNGKIFCPTGVTYPNETISITGATNYGAPSYASGGCTANNQASLSSYDALVNAYIDLGTWYSVTPYIGAGVGLSFGHYSTSSTYTQANSLPYQVTYTDPQFGSFYQDYDRATSGNYYNLAWALMGGFAVDIYAHTKLDVGYRYLNLGQVPGMTNKLTYQEVRAGLRYMIDN